MSEGNAGPISGFADGPEFWFDGSGHLWFGHRCGVQDREYTLVEAIYEVISRDPLTVAQVISCGLCSLKGNITDGEWVPMPNKLLKERHGQSPNRGANSAGSADDRAAGADT